MDRRQSGAQGRCQVSAFLGLAALALALLGHTAEAGRLHDNYYEILGVEKNATTVEIKKAFRRQALSYHPDKNTSPDAVLQFERLSSAYEVLADANERAAYDEGFEMLMSDLSKDFGSFLYHGLQILRDLWAQVEGELQIPFNVAVCSGLEISIFDPIMSIFQQFISDSDDDSVVILEQQYPGLALGEAVSQAWLKDHLCPEVDAYGNLLQHRQELTLDALVIPAAALLFWYLPGRYLAMAAGAYTLVLSQLSTEQLPIWREGPFLAMTLWAVNMKLPVLLAAGYLLFLQVALVFLGSLPLHVMHRAGLGSALMAVVSWCFSTALLSLWGPAYFLGQLNIDLSYGLALGAVLAVACYFPLDGIRYPSRALAQRLLKLWLWFPITSSKMAEGFALMPFGLAPFSLHPRWMMLVHRVCFRVLWRLPSWVLNRSGTFLSYFVISSILLLSAAAHIPELGQVALLPGIGIGLGSAALLWAARVVAIRFLGMPVF